MLTVSIAINAQPIFTRTAVRVETGQPNKYQLDDGSIIEHDYKDGAVELAIKMLKTIKEVI